MYNTTDSILHINVPTDDVSYINYPYDNKPTGGQYAAVLRCLDLPTNTATTAVPSRGVWLMTGIKFSEHYAVEEIKTYDKSKSSLTYRRTRDTNGWSDWGAIT